MWNACSYAIPIHSQQKLTVTGKTEYCGLTRPFKDIQNTALLQYLSRFERPFELLTTFTRWFRCKTQDDTKTLNIDRSVLLIPSQTFTNNLHVFIAGASFPFDMAVMVFIAGALKVNPDCRIERAKVYYPSVAPLPHQNIKSKKNKQENLLMEKRTGDCQLLP